MTLKPKAHDIKALAYDISNASALPRSLPFKVRTQSLLFWTSPFQVFAQMSFSNPRKQFGQHAPFSVKCVSSALPNAAVKRSAVITEISYTQLKKADDSEEARTLILIRQYNIQTHIIIQLNKHANSFP